MRAVEFLIEFELPKNKWELVVSDHDKQELGSDLVTLVRQAYANTPRGSFVNSIKDVIPSDWNVIDWDNDPDVDSCVFYRRNRNNEKWSGYKIQGLGHDGTRTSKDKAISKIQELLSNPGVWIESSDAMRHVLKKLNVPSITNEKFLQKLFNDPNLKMIDDDTYVRFLPDGKKIIETVFGNPKLIKDTESVDEEIINEVPLPADWDPQQYAPGSTFKQRLAYALERAKKIGTGSSRVATIIEYQGRPTVLKIAKNQKGLAQNSVEADILSDGYASQLGILIPIIDYDEQNREPTWVHTELAQKANEKQLCQLMGCDNLSQLINMAWAIVGKRSYLGNYQGYVEYLQKHGKNEQDIETMTEYANKLAELNSNFDVELGDFARAANWGLYNGHPIIVDVGFNSNVLNQYYNK